MTNEEAIQNLIQISKMYGHKWQQEACDIAIEAIKKQIPKKIEIENIEYQFPKYWCPLCKKQQKATFKNRRKGCYCERCGQKLDWGEGEPE